MLTQFRIFLAVIILILVNLKIYSECTWSDFLRNEMLEAIARRHAEIVSFPV